jgi:hypothetical protein
VPVSGTSTTSAYYEPQAQLCPFRLVPLRSDVKQLWPQKPQKLLSHSVGCDPVSLMRSELLPWEGRDPFPSFSFL